jgi:hypothetical protein
MAQLTLYLDRETEEKMKAAARAAGTSLSQWVASLIRDRIAGEWPASVAALAGSWKDDFPSLEEIRHGADEEPRREAM